VDKRFVYYLLASEGICVVPLTGFCCKRQGFRITLLETDDEKRRTTWHRIGKAVKAYVESSR
jgi:aspartate/methionine/tyrosine aminotransferase